MTYASFGPYLLPDAPTGAAGRGRKLSRKIDDDDDGLKMATRGW